MKTKDDIHFVYCPALATMWKYSSRRCAVRGARRRAIACTDGWTYVVLRETKDTWEVWEGVTDWDGDPEGPQWISARMLKIFICGEGFTPWDAEVVS